MTQRIVREVLLKHDEIQRYYRVRLTAIGPTSDGEYVVASEAADSPEATMSLMGFTYGNLTESEMEFNHRKAKAESIGYTLVSSDSYTMFGF
jgi:hypothetical protein